MNADSPRFRLQTQAGQEQEAIETKQMAAAPALREFATPEELLRHDASQTPVPPALAERLRESVQSEPAPRRAWWQRWFNRNNP